MKKRELAFLVAVIAILTGVASYQWPQPAEVRPEVSQESSSSPRQVAKLIWRVQPSYSRYGSFSIEVSGTEDGAVWNAHLVAALEDEPCRTEGKLSSEEWNDFLRGFESAGGWRWHELAEGEEPQPTDQTSYTLDIPAWGSKRVYGLPTEQHVELANFMNESFVGRAETYLDKACSHRRPRP